MVSTEQCFQIALFAPERDLVIGVLRHPSTLPAATERVAFLRRIGEEIDALGEELLTVCAEETGLGRDRLAGAG